MSKIALITDSSCDLTQEIIKKYNIKVAPLRIIYKDKEYIDRVNIQPKEVYDRLSQEIPTTSMPSMQDIDDLFTAAEDEGCTHVIAITISSGLSGTFNTFKLVSDQHHNLTTFVFDSKTLSAGLGAVVAKCGELIAYGKSFEEIVNLLPSIKERVLVYYVVETLEYLKKGGRIGRVAGTIGDLLKLKPIISVDDDGKYFTYAKVRGRKQSISKLADIAKDVLAAGKAEVYILQGGAMEEGQLLYEAFVGRENISAIHFTDISPALGVHTGPGLLGIIMLKEG
ncbi:DegV family protein [Clostridium swellfunianum]|uniref:DegV family protein n=1 Tax=Clostridium swellfunianum TaxID=1367462 RepID=UPI00202F1A55|nr:DegV family protein [Clostridium swellfunianum]MCM0649490.1 DegV family protein [Clostridium swellfunianum]